MAGQGFFKGEKKKQKKDKNKAITMSVSDRPTFTMPQIISKKKQEM
jgi:hypothetical protein